MRFADARVTKYQNVFTTLDEAACCKLKDQRSVDSCVEAPVKCIQCLTVAQFCGFYSTFDKAVTPTIYFVVDRLERCAARALRRSPSISYARLPDE